MEKNKVIEIYRSIFLIFILIYHIYVLSGCMVSNNLLHNVISLGGEVGVTGFFILSGLGIYCNWSRNEQVKMSEFLKRRMKRIYIPSRKC